MEFPQYRKYLNGQSYFKINSHANFEEYKLMGSTLKVYSIEAKILPDRNYISDMLINYQTHWEKIDEQAFSDFLESHLPIK